MRYYTHPITIPRGQVDYEKLATSGINGESLTLAFPNGEILNAHVYFGKAGYGPYYQIRTYSGQSIPKYLCEGEVFIVNLQRRGLKSYAFLEYIK